MSYLIRRVLAKPRLILDEMAVYTESSRLIFPRTNGPIVSPDPSDCPWVSEDVEDPTFCKGSIVIIKNHFMLFNLYLLKQGNLHY